MRRRLRCRGCAKRLPLPDTASADIDKAAQGIVLLPLWSDVMGTRTVIAGLSGGAVVAMVQPVDLWDRDDAPGRRRHDGRGVGESLSRLRCVRERM